MIIKERMARKRGPVFEGEFQKTKKSSGGKDRHTPV